MFSDYDERNGIVKTTWAKVREQVAKVEPTFAKLVDEVAPDKSFPLFLVYYPYGVLKGDPQGTLFPTETNSYAHLGDPNLPKAITKHLGYDVSPLGMVLEKNLEVFVDLPSKKLSIPSLIYGPGSMFPFYKILGTNTKSIANFLTKGIFSVSSGVRSTFMLPNIGNETLQANLHTRYGADPRPARNLYDHWPIFSQIINSPAIDCPWRSCVLYFSEKFIKKILDDHAWSQIKLHLYTLGWENWTYERNREHYDLTFSLLQEKCNLKPNPYLADTAHHLYAVALSASPGYVPAISEDALPTNLLQKIFVEDYRLKQHFPTIMQPSHFNLQKKQPVYYSLQHPAIYMFSPKSRYSATTLHEIRELERIIRLFNNKLSGENTFYAHTSISEISKNIDFSYYHNKPDKCNIIKLTGEMTEKDRRFTQVHHQYDEAVAIADSGTFLRGCVAISSK